MGSARLTEGGHVTTVALSPPSTSVMVIRNSTEIPVKEAPKLRRTSLYIQAESPRPSELLPTTHGADTLPSSRRGAPASEGLSDLPKVTGLLQLPRKLTESPPPLPVFDPPFQIPKLGPQLA